MAEKQTVSLEDYLEAIYFVKRKDGIARISTISDYLDVKKPSASYAINKLTKQGLVQHEDYGYVDLTPKGLKLAREVADKHKLLTVFIADILGIEKEAAEEEACSMEHYLSDDTKDKLDGLVEFILSGPRSDEWIENLRYYQKKRKRSPQCIDKCTSKNTA